MVRMADTDVARELAKQLADIRWRGRGVDRAIETLESRPEQLTTERLERLRALVDESEVSE
jgi:hypothetical protein